MKPVIINGTNNYLKASSNWDFILHGPCCDLYVRALRSPDGIVSIKSAWIPTPAELIKLNKGHPVILNVIAAQHPPVWIKVGDISDLAIITLPDSNDAKIN